MWLQARGQLHSNVMHYHQISSEFAANCMQLHYHHFIFCKVMNYVTLLFKCNALAALHYMALLKVHYTLHYFAKCNALQGITHYHYPGPVLSCKTFPSARYFHCPWKSLLLLSHITFIVWFKCHLHLNWQWLFFVKILYSWDIFQEWWKCLSLILLVWGNN